MSDDRSWGETEARWPGDSRPPFGRGNSMSVTHGAWVPERVAAEAERVRGQLLERFEFLGDEMFVTALERYCSAQARANLLSGWIDDVVEGRKQARPVRKGAPTTGVEAVPERVWRAVAAAESNAQKFGSECGLDPAGFARIAKELGWARQLAGHRVGDLMESGRELRLVRGDGPRTGPKAS